MGILTNIKQRPDNQRKFFSLILAIIFTLIIVIVWFSFTNVASNSLDSVEKTDKLSSLSPWQVIKDEFSKAFSNLNNNPEVAATNTVPIEIVAHNLSTSTATSSELSTTSNLIN